MRSSLWGEPGGRLGDARPAVSPTCPRSAIGRAICAAVIVLALALCGAGRATAQGRAPVAPELGALGVHVVRAGETLHGVASRYGMRADQLARLNATSLTSVLLPGRQLWVPLESAINARAGEAAGAQVTDGSAGSGVLSTPSPGAGEAAVAQAADGSSGSGALSTAPPGADAVTYVVASGDTLFGLSDRFGASVDDLKRWNGLPADGSIRAGETLVVGGGSSEPQSAPAAPVAGSPAHNAYTVVPGDTLASIAERHGTTVTSLQRANGLYGELIRDGQTLLVPRAGSGYVTGGGPKRIEISVSEQRMYVWQGEQLVWNWLTSTGMDGWPTRRGTFAVQSKIPNAWSTPWQLWMPHWLGIYWAGGSENGIHALPIINGQRLWAGSLGTPISYGCLVLGTSEAELLYNWAEIGTQVVIHD